MGYSFKQNWFQKDNKTNGLEILNFFLPCKFCFIKSEFQYFKSVEIEVGCSQQ